MPELNTSSKSHARIWNKIGERIRRNFMLQAVAGTLPGVCVHRIFGFDTEVSVGTTPVWPGSGQYPYFDGAQTVRLVSDDANDIYNGSGAWLIRLTGLDDNHEMQMEDISLRGTTPVLTQGEYTHVYHATVLKAGSRVGAAGTITLSVGTAPGTAIGFVFAPTNTMMNGVFTVPAHTNAYLYEYHFNVEHADDATVTVRFTTPVEEDEVWVTAHIDLTVGAGTGHQQDILVAPFFFPPLTDIELTAEKSLGVIATVTASATILLIDTAFEWDSYLAQDETYSIQRPDED